LVNNQPITGYSYLTQNNLFNTGLFCFPYSDLNGKMESFLLKDIFSPRKCTSLFAKKRTSLIAKNCTFLFAKKRTLLFTVYIDSGATI